MKNDHGENVFETLTIPGIQVFLRANYTADILDDEYVGAYTSQLFQAYFELEDHERFYGVYDSIPATYQNLDTTMIQMVYTSSDPKISHPLIREYMESHPGGHFSGTIRDKGIDVAKQLFTRDAIQRAQEFDREDDYDWDYDWD
jgi:hypothetical protein